MKAALARIVEALAIAVATKLISDALDRRSERRKDAEEPAP